MSAPECPRCAESTKSDGSECLGWLHPSGQYPGLLHCNCCGDYYCRAQAQNFVTGRQGLLYVPNRELWRWEAA